MRTEVVAAASAQVTSQAEDVVSLATNDWNYFRPFHFPRAQLIALPLAPVVVLAMWNGFEWFGGAAALTAMILFWLSVRVSNSCHATPEHVVCRSGWLGLGAERLAVAAIDDIIVEPIRWLPGLGDITLRSGSRYLHFECVADAAAVRSTLLEWRKRHFDGVDGGQSSRDGA